MRKIRTLNIFFAESGALAQTVSKSGFAENFRSLTVNEIEMPYFLFFSSFFFHFDQSYITSHALFCMYKQ
jgi:hypothetical protein